jgi:hypothetical protein
LGETSDQIVPTGTCCKSQHGTKVSKIQVAKTLGVTRSVALPPDDRWSAEKEK